MTSRKRLAWLLWFALLLPFGQLAAAAHELAHVPAAAASAKAQAHPAACEVCVLAAAVGAGGAASTPQGLDAGAVPALPPLARPALGALPGFAPHFRSRAPPAA